MLVQLICRSDKSPETKEALEEPFEYDTVNNLSTGVILVPDLESYNETKGQLFLDNMEAEVVCIPPPSEYKPPVGKVPYAIIHPDYVARCDPTEAVTTMGTLTYYFRPKTEKKVIYD